MWYIANMRRREQLKLLMSMCGDCGCARYPFCNVNGRVCNECEHHRNLKLIKDENLKINDDIKANGDCLFECISKAFGQSISIDELRDSIARAQTQSTYSVYKELEHSDFPYMKKDMCDTLADFQSFIRKRGMYFGLKHCYWGDENALGIMARNLCTSIAIYDECGDLLQTMEANNRFHRYLMLMYIEEEYHYVLISGNRDNHCSIFFGKPKNKINIIY